MKKNLKSILFALGAFVTFLLSLISIILPMRNTFTLDESKMYGYKAVMDKNTSKSLITRITPTSEIPSEEYLEFENKFTQKGEAVVSKEIDDYKLVINSEILDENLSLLSTTPYGIDGGEVVYNLSHIYGTHSWQLLEEENTVFIPRSVMKKINNEYDIFNPKTDYQITLKNGDKVVQLTVKGIYDDQIVDNTKHWRLIGNYYNEALDNCLFVSSKTLSNLKTAGIDFSYIALLRESANDFVDKISLLEDFCKKDNRSYSYPIGNGKNNTKLIDSIKNIEFYYKGNVRVIVSVFSYILYGLFILGTMVLFFFAFKYLKIRKKRIDTLIIYLAPILVMLEAVGFVSITKAFKLTIIDNVPINFSNYISLSLIYIATLVVVAFLVLINIKKIFQNIINNKSEEIMLEGQEIKEECNVFATLNTGTFSSSTAIRHHGIGELLDPTNESNYYLTLNKGNYQEVEKTEYGKCITMRYFTGKFFLLKIINHAFLSTRTTSYLISNFINPKNIFVSASISYRHIKRIARHYKSKGTRIFVIIDEYYTKSEFNNRSIITNMMISNNMKIINKLSESNISFICISKCLFDLFKNRGARVFLLPMVVNKLDYSNEHKKHDPVNFLYAGVPSKKDELIKTLEGFALLSDEELSMIHIDLAGVGSEYINENLEENVCAKINNIVTQHGFLDKNLIDDLYLYADFTFLLRDKNELFAKAGFPSKVTDSLIRGVPVVCNITSDLNDYLKDEYNAYICKEDTAECFAETVSKILKNKDKFDDLKANAYDSALTKLTLDIYKEDFLKFIKE